MFAVMLFVLIVGAQQSDAIATPPQQRGPPAFLTDLDLPKGVTPAGTTRTGLMVGAKGRVEKCRILETSGSAQLDALACKILVRLVFDPARTTTGKAVAVEVERKMTWGPTPG